MSLTHTTTSRCTKTSERISREVAEFLDAGGEINEIPRGQSGHNLELKTEKGNHGHRVVWADPKMLMTSKEGRAASIRYREAEKINKAAKGGKLAGVTRHSKAQAEMDKNMPKILELKSKGLSNREIGKAIKKSHGTVGAWLRIHRDKTNAK